MKRKIDLSMQLTQSFTLREFVDSATAQRLGIDNTPQWQHVVALLNLCRNVLQPLRDHIGRPIVINSGYRCEALNEAVHGVGRSQHLLGEAADLHISNVAEGRLFYDFILTHCPFDQLLFEYNRCGAIWIHVSCKQEVVKNRRMALPNYHVKQ